MDGYHAYKVLNISKFKHFPINHSVSFADKTNPIYVTLKLLQWVKTYFAEIQRYRQKERQSISEERFLCFNHGTVINPLNISKPVLYPPAWPFIKISCVLS